MRRPLLLLALFLIVVVYGVVHFSHDEGTASAREVARKASERLESQRPRTAEEVGYAASLFDRVEVMRVTGTSTHDGDGVHVIVRTTGYGYEGALLAAERYVVRRCFRVRVSPEAEWGAEPRKVDCPDGPALAFRPPPEPPRLPYEELRRKLPRVPKGGRADEAGVRRVVAALDMDPKIRTEVRADGDRVGVLLLVPGNGFDPQDCLLARVAPGDTSVWVPSRMQRMPGEAGCGVGNALDPAPPPH
ncbi:translation initiation factor IF-2 [Streptomyces sp. NPDC093071]|uniref:translation initiation factor IF-2 n=1 Tax=Streptomyces sp. NPDC093071 TaxID=3366022 RepID=UPI0037F4AC36